MKLNNIFKNYDGYVVALIKVRDSDGYPKDIEYKSCCTTFEEAAMERKALSGMDVIICPPFRRGDIPPAEAADYFRVYLGANGG